MRNPISAEVSRRIASLAVVTGTTPGTAPCGRAVAVKKQKDPTRAAAPIRPRENGIAGE